jgi:hypothetical protein
MEFNFKPILKGLGLNPDVIMEKFQETTETIQDRIKTYDANFRNLTALIEGQEQDRIAIVSLIDDLRDIIKDMHQDIIALRDDIQAWRMRADPTAAPVTDLVGDGAKPYAEEFGEMMAHGGMEAMQEEMLRNILPRDGSGSLKQQENSGPLLSEQRGRLLPSPATEE